MRFYTKTLMILGGVSVLLTSATIFAASSGYFSEIRSLLAHHQTDQAYNLAQAMSAQYAGDSNFDYLYGMAALQSGHPQQASFAFERMLIVHPKNVQVRLADALAQVAMKDYVQAQDSYNALLKMNPPPAVRQNIQNFISVIEAAKSSGSQPDNAKPQLMAYVKFNAGFDTNVNSATASDFIIFPTLGSIPFIINSTSQETGSSFGELQAGLTGMLPLNENFVVFGSVSGSGRKNGDAHLYDNHTASGLVGAMFKVHDYTVTTPIMTQAYDLNQTRYRNIASFAPQITHPLGKQFLVGGFFEYDRLFYPNSLVGTVRAQDTNMTMSGPLIMYKFPTLPLSISNKDFYGNEKGRASGFPWVSRHLWGTENTLTWYKSAITTPYSTVRLQRSDYDGAVPGYIAYRHDTEFDFIVGSKFSVNKNWVFEPSYTYVNNGSNTSLFAFTRNQFMLSLTYMVATR